MLTSKLVYPAWVILGRAPVAPTLASSSFFSSEVIRARRSSRATENGIRGSPGLFVSIHALILGSLPRHQQATQYSLSLMNSPFILLANVIPFTQVDKVCDGLCGEELEAIDDVYLRRAKNQYRKRRSRLLHMDKDQRTSLLLQSAFRMSFPSTVSVFRIFSTVALIQCQ